MRKPPRGFWDHINKKPPETLYHYTSLESLMKIVSSKSLLATDSRFLNDTKELVHLTSTIIDRTEERLQSAGAETKPALNWLLTHLKSNSYDPVYVISFSAKGDDLSQWRGYTQSGQGVCIGFRTKALKEALELAKAGRHNRARFLLLGRIIYLGESEGESFDDFISSVCQHVDVIDGEAVRTVAAERLVVSAMPFYKHTAFRNEHEWRIRMSANSVFTFEDPIPVESRIGKSSLVPSARLTFKGTTLENSFIKDILIGPTPMQELSKYSMQEFVNAERLQGVVVRSSQLPYRNW